MTRRVKAILKKTALHLSIGLVLLIVLFPIYWMFMNSLKPIKEIRTQSTRIIPANPTLDNYRRVAKRTEFKRYLLNSLIVTSAVVSLSVVISIFTGYALSRFTFLGKQTFSIGLLASQTLSPVLLAIPLFLILRKLRLVNTYQGLTLTYLTVVLPFSSWMLRGYFDTIPIELEQAAMIDGCSRVGVVFRILFPLSAPGIATVAIFGFILAWQEYLYALTIMTSQKMMTATVGITSFIGVEEIKWGQMGAFASILTFPAIIFFVLVQKYVVQGLTRGAVKE